MAEGSRTLGELGESGADALADLAAVDRPIEQARGLPNWLYTTAAGWSLERERLFAPTWACVGFGKDVPAPGDVRPVDLMGLPLILLRDHAGEIRVFHNVCSHRGLELVTEPCRVKHHLRCPYHSWTYGLDGSLAKTPMIGGPGRNDCPGFDRSRHGLKPVRSAVWFDVVFVNLSGTAPAFEDHVAPLAQRWSAFEGVPLRHGGSESSIFFDLACNWKLAVENYCEAYHLPWVHPGLNSYSRIEDHYDIAEPGFAGQGSTAYRQRLGDGSLVLPAAPELPPAWQEGAEYVALFPNVLLGLHRDHFYAVRIDPAAPDRCREHFEIYYFADAPSGPAYAGLRAENYAGWREIFAEDQEVVERMQRGRASPAYQGGAFSPAMDGPTHCFHRWVARQLMVTAPSAVAAE